MAKLLTKMASAYRSIRPPNPNPDPELQAPQLNLQTLEKKSHSFLILCLTWNTIAVAAAWIRGEVKREVFFLAFMYFKFGLPVAYFTWHRRFGYAIRSEDGKKYKWFFFFYAIHIGLCGLACVGSSLIGKSVTGYYATLDAFGSDGLIGFLYLIGWLLFCVEFVVSVLVFHGVYRYYCGVVCTKKKDVESLIEDRVASYRD